MAQSCGMMFNDLLDDSCYGDKNAWNTFPVSGQKITLSNQRMRNRMKQNQNEFENEQSRNRSKKNGAEWVNMKSKQLAR
jgi:hypothetical protein